MLREEFERLAGYRVTEETYKKVIEPMYMATDLPKREFARLLNREAFEAKEERKPNIKIMKVRNRLGEERTPNNCYYYIQYVDLVDVDIRTGKYIIKDLPVDTLREIAKSQSLDLGYSPDFDYTQCIDTHRKPITLIWED